MRKLGGSRETEAGIDRVILNINFGMSQPEQLDCIQQFAEEVMPHFASVSNAVAAE